MMKLKIKGVLLSLVVVFAVMMCSFTMNTANTVYALSSWSPQTGYMPGIGIDPGITVTPLPSIDPSITIPAITLPYIETTSSPQIYARDYLYVENESKNRKWGDYPYLKFVDYFKITRQDGRKIYSASDWYNENLDTVNYKAYLWVKQSPMESNNDGFFWTTQRAKWEYGTYYLTFCSDGCTDDSFDVDIIDESGEKGVNPGDSTILLGHLNKGNESLPYTNGYFSVVEFYGKAYWHNEFWGNTWNSQTVSTTMTPKINNIWRTWDNTLTPQDDKVAEVTQNGQRYLYHNQPFVVVADNLNNYIKVNGNKVTPNVDANVTAYYDGFHIGIVNEGVTTVSIEDGAKERYTDYKCIIDNLIPDINFNYTNKNALDKVQYGALTKMSDGSYSQGVSNAKFRDKVQVEFGAGENESPEIAQYLYNGEIHDITSGTWLENAGEYTLIVQDLVGNRRTVSFTIDDTLPTINYNNLANCADYKITKWYKVIPPINFDAFESYTYKSHQDALNKAIELEFANNVSILELTNLEDFIETNVADNGDINNTDDDVRLGTYWLYKSISNPDVNLYYFDYNYLCKALSYFAVNYVQGPFYFYQNGENDYGKILDVGIVDNVWNKKESPAFIGNNFSFTKNNDDESYQIFYSYADNTEESWIQLVYNKPFGQQVAQHGLYKIKEIDYVGHESTYFVYYDKEPPVLIATVTNYGGIVSYTKTISHYDIPENAGLVYYFANFKIDEIIDDDTWYVLNVTAPDGQVYNYTYDDDIPNLETLGTGEFTIKLFDRVNNTFEFQVAILGKAPTVTFTEINTNSQLQVDINQGEDYNTVTNLKIYKNNKLLNNENGYDEFPEKTSDELIYIDIDKFSYVFNKGGIYKVELTDNYGRILTYEYKFEKDLPTGILLGVKHNGKTNTDVQFIYNSNRFLFTITENESAFENYISEYNEESNLTTITIKAVEDVFNYYQIILYNNEDLENFNNYNFYIKTVAPTINLVGVENGGVTSSDVYATWEENEELLTSNYSINNGQISKYRKSQVLSVEGTYYLDLTDSLGNTNYVTFNIDRTLDFTILENDVEKTQNEVRYTNKNISIRNNENLDISILKDNEIYTYNFGEYITSEGTYLVQISDEYHNTTLFYITIDLTPPTAKLIGVDNFGTTTNFVRVEWEDLDNTAVCILNNSEPVEYINGDSIILNGNYKIIVYDKAQNSIEFEFKIDNKLDYFVNTFYNGYSNGDVYVLALEYLTIDMYKNEVKIDYQFEQKLTEQGNYRFLLKDELGNEEMFYFSIIQKPVQKLDSTFNESVKITSILRDGNEYTNDIISRNKLYLFEEGNYQVTVVENDVEYAFSIAIDTTPPTLVLVGVEAGGYTKGEVSTRNVSDPNATITALFNGNEIEYKLGDKLKNAGVYKIRVTDEAGNFTEYEFTIVYALNGASIALIAGALALVVVIIAITIWQRRKYKKAKIEYEVETDLEEDK